MEIRMILVCSIGYILGMAVFEFFKWKVNCIKRPPEIAVTIATIKTSWIIPIIVSRNADTSLCFQTLYCFFIQKTRVENRFKENRTGKEAG